MNLNEALKVVIYLCDPETPEEAKAADVLARLEVEWPKIGEELGRFCAWTAESEGYVTPTNAEIHYKTMHAILSRLDASRE